MPGLDSVDVPGLLRSSHCLHQLVEVTHLRSDVNLNNENTKLKLYSLLQKKTPKNSLLFVIYGSLLCVYCCHLLDHDVSRLPEAGVECVLHLEPARHL